VIAGLEWMMPCGQFTCRMAKPAPAPLPTSNGVSRTYLCEMQSASVEKAAQQAVTVDSEPYLSDAMRA